MMGELKLQFDTMEVNTGLAKEYISKHNGEFVPLGFERSERFELDSANNKLYKSDQENVACSINANENSPVRDRTIFEKLAQKMEENAELFSQLEALIRKKRKEEVKNWDIQLIVQNLLYHSVQDFNHSEQESLGEEFHLVLHNDSPLASLGHIVKLFRKITIHAAQNTGVVCHLFTELCHEVGLKQVVLKFDACTPNLDDQLRDAPKGCIGVITAQSDIDSAVDTLLASSIQYPWKVERVLVQESVYETVQKTFKGKCGLKTVDAKFEACTVAMTHRNKMILFDNVANYENDTKQGIDAIMLVEAYRTTKELISLINKQQTLCISLWCSNSAEADEIAFSINTHVVWINEFGSFWGPPEASQAFYSLKERYITPNGDSDVEKLLKVLETWKKVDMKSRKAIVKDVIESCADHGDWKERVSKLIRKRSSEKETFVEIQNNRMCIGERLLGEVLLHVNSDIEEAIKYLISGKAVIAATDTIFEDWLIALAKKGLPVIFKSNFTHIIITHDKCNMNNKYAVFDSKTKVVYKNFGTIFAN